MTLRHHIEGTVAKAFLTYLRTYSLFESRSLSTNIKLTLYEALVRPVMTYVCPTWEYAADAHRLKLQRLQNRVLRATGNLDKCTLVRELHVSLKIPCLYDYKTKLCRTQAEVILNHVNQMYVVLDKENRSVGSIRGLNFAAVRPTTVQLTNCSFRVVA
jgi:hypothetical protein